MPDDRDTWRLVLAGLDETAQPLARGRLVRRVRRRRPSRGRRPFAAGALVGGCWEKLDVARAWSVCTRMIVAAFYSHPWAWNEIGFGGPAYPRGFMRLGPVGVPGAVRAARSDR